MAAEYDIANAFEKIENDLISSLIRNFKRHRAEETAEGYNWSQWQAEQLRALEEYKKHNRKKYGTEFRSINSQLDELLRTTYKDGSAAQEREIIEAVRNGFELPKTPQKGIEGAFFKTNESKLDALVKATRNDMEKAEHAVLRRCDDRYRKIIYEAQVAANTGALTYEQAVDMATKDFLSSGVDCIVYKNGARHGIAEYSRMAIRTANKRANLMGEGAKRDKMGVRTVIVNKRHNACPRCAEWVGKVLIDDVYSGGTKADGDYPMLSDAIKGGLFHPNCKDGTSTYYPELTEIEKIYPHELTEMEQRETLEIKRDAARSQAEKFERMSENSLDAKNKRKYAARAKQWREREAEVNDQLKAMEEKPKPKPEQPKTEKPKPEQPKPSAANHAEKPLEKPEKPVEKSGESGIIKEKKVNTASEAKKVLKDKIGFDLVESSVDLVDSDLLVENTNQLQKLEDKFGIIHRSTGAVCAVNEKAGTIAYVNRKATNPLCQNLSLCPLHFSSRKALIDEMKHLVESGHSMPCLLTDSELSVYSVTHEYGHMLQNSLVQGRMKELGWDESNPRVFVDNSKKTKKARLKWYKNVDDTVKDENFREIIDIAKRNNPQFSLTDNISMYGKKNKSEFFAEVFANSQLSKPNELGKAMNIWLNEKGLIL